MEEAKQNEPQTIDMIKHKILSTSVWICFLMLCLKIKDFPQIQQTNNYIDALAHLSKETAASTYISQYIYIINPHLFDSNDLKSVLLQSNMDFQCQFYQFFITKHYLRYTVYGHGLIFIGACCLCSGHCEFMLKEKQCLPKPTKTQINNELKNRINHISHFFSK